VHGARNPRRSTGSVSARESCIGIAARRGFSWVLSAVTRQATGTRRRLRIQWLCFGRHPPIAIRPHRQRTDGRKQPRCRRVGTMRMLDVQRCCNVVNGTTVESWSRSPTLAPPIVSDAGVWRFPSTRGPAGWSPWHDSLGAASGTILENGRMRTETASDFSWRRTGTQGGEILNAAGAAIGWTVDDLWGSIT
jgi:hypothetical protein